MKKRTRHLMNIFAGAVTMLSLDLCAAQVIVYPAPAMTVADCQGGKVWTRRESNGLPFCDSPDTSPVDPTPSPPAAPVCRFEYPTYMVSLGPAMCSSQDTCFGAGVAVNAGSRDQSFAAEFDDYELDLVDGLRPVEKRADEILAATPYRRGAARRYGGGQGNTLPKRYYELCE